MDLFYAIRLTHNISLLTNLCSSICQIHGLPSTLKKNRLPSFSKDGSFFLLFSSYYSVLIVKFCSIPLSEAVRSSEAEADPCVYPPLAGQVGSEVSRVGPVQVGVPV